MIETHDGVGILTHPLAQHRLCDVRDVDTGRDSFREALAGLGRVCGSELVADRLATESVPVETPLAETTGVRVADDVVVIAVLRAAIPFVAGMLDTIPGARQGVVSASRQERARQADGGFPISVEYSNVPALDSADTIVVADPMLATGSTMAAVLESLFDETVPESTIALSVVSTEPGIERVTAEFPSVDILTVAIDDSLDEDGFIVPGLGDAGDRAFGTE